MSGSANEAFQRTAHFLRRAGFGATRDEVQACARRGLDATIREALHYDSALPENTFELVQDRLQGDFLDFNNFQDLQVWWLQKMVNTDRPLQEKMTLFWHGHFVSAYSKVRSPELIFRQNQLFRKHAIGNFRQLALEVSRDPAMILYLDNQTNRKGHANENYARELFELFTLGIGNYTEQDIHEAARAFTGWSTNRVDGQFVFLPRQHDYDTKTVFGKTGTWDGQDIVNLAVTRPESAQFICTKLFKFFVHDSPTPHDVAPFAAILRSSNYEVRPVLDAMFRSPVFYSDKAVWGKVKSPVEFVVGSLRTTRAEIPARLAPQALKSMGQELFNAPNVKGWDGGMTWINTTTLLSRFNFAMQLARLNELNQPLLVNIREMIESARLQSAEQVVDYFTAEILHRTVSPHTRETLIEYMHCAPDGSRQPFEVAASGPGARQAMLKVHGLMHIIMLTPEYQMV